MSTGDYAKAQWLPSPNFWAGGDGNAYVVIHATASGGPQTGYQLATSTEFTDGKSKSVHYINDVDGNVYQIVREADSAWGNCCTAGTSPFVNAPGKPTGYNWNRCTISIENVKHSSDNSEPLTTAQYQSLLALVRDICQRQKIPLSYGTPAQPGIIFHHDLDPINKARCPGTFPYDTFLSDLKGGAQPMPVVLNSKGEVADFVDVSQMEPNESEMACGYFAAGECKFAGPPGKGPTGTPEQLDQWADAQGGLNTEGVSIEDMHNLFKAAGLHYWDTDIAPGTQQSHDIATIKAALQHGYPVVGTVAETSVFDMDLNGNPYAPNWTPTGNHVFTYTGIAPDGNLLVHDTAAITGGIFGKVSRQPRRYRASSIENHWASIVQLPWLPPIPNGDPLSWQPVGGNVPTPAPQPAPAGNTNQQKQFQDIWNASAVLLGGTAPSYTSGIANEWKNKYMPKYFVGPPVTPEFHTIDWAGRDIIVQLFLNGVCQYTLNVGGRWWLGDKEITF
jgi:N-acetyl-anhydromuramyl-L-alanine amidase AmpD